MERVVALQPPMDVTPTANTSDPAIDDVAYLTQLGLLKGHLFVGYALYLDGKATLSETHMKHPEAEIYADLVPAFEARGCGGFADGLDALTAVVTEGGEVNAVGTVFQALVAEIQSCEAAANFADPVIIVRVIENLLRTAGDEYEIGVVDGAMYNLHEYQDAWGFTQVAAVWAGTDAITRGRAAEMARPIQDVIASLDHLWPALDTEGPIEGDAATLFEASTRVALIAEPLAPR